LPICAGWGSNGLRSGIDVCQQTKTNGTETAHTAALQNHSSSELASAFSTGHTEASVHHGHRQSPRLTKEMNKERVAADAKTNRSSASSGNS